MRVHPLRAAQTSRDTSPEITWAVLAPLLAARGRVRVSRDGGRTYRARDERAVSDRLPNQPAALLVYDRQGCAPVICLDLDSSRGGPAAVERDLRSLTRLLDRLGVRWFADSSPNGGRHLYVPLAEPAPFHEARSLTLALAARTPTLDPLPMMNLAAGCIRPPGARHRTGGHQSLDGSVGAAADALHRPTPAEAWRRLQEETAAWAAPAAPPEPATDRGEAGPEDRLDALHGIPEPNATFTTISRTGDWSASKYRSASEARQAVVWAAAASGWSFADVARRLTDGTWPGLASMYARYSSRHRNGALVRDWRRAAAFEKTRRQRKNQRSDAGGANSVRLRTTSPHKTQRGAGGDASSGRESVRGLSTQAANREVRVWMAAVDMLTKNSDPTERAVLYALGEAAALVGRVDVEHGNRSLAIATGLDQSTVGRILKRLRDQPTDRLLIDLVRDAEGTRAHTYLLIVPNLLRPACEKKPWRRGKIHAVRPVFRELGTTAAFVYDALEQARESLSGRELAEVVGLGHTATYDALAVLASWGLADRTSDGWSLGRASPTALAERLGVQERVTDQVERYRAERHAWWRYLGLGHLLDEPEPEVQDWDSTTPPVPPLRHGPPQPLRLVDPGSTSGQASRPGEDERDRTALRLLRDVLGASVVDVAG